MSRNAGTDLRGSLAQLGLLVRVKALFGAGGALGSMEGFKAAAQAGVAESTVAAAVAGKLVGYVSDLRNLLIDMDLPWVL